MQRYRPLRKLLKKPNNNNNNNENNNTALNSSYEATLYSLTAFYSLCQITKNYETNYNLRHEKRGLPVLLLKM